MKNLIILFTFTAACLPEKGDRYEEDSGYYEDTQTNTDESNSENDNNNNGGSTGLSCEYYLDLQDSVGDGWDGANLEVYADDIFIGSAECSNGTTQETISFEVYQGEELSIKFNSGDYDEEVYYALYDSNFDFLFDDGPNPQSGTVYSTNVICN